MVISWDKSENDPDLSSPAGETIQAPVRDAGGYAGRRRRP